MKSNSKLDTVAGEAMNQETNTHAVISDGRSASCVLWKSPVVLQNPILLSELHCSSLVMGLNSQQPNNQNHYLEYVPDHNYLQTNISKKIVSDYNYPSKLYSSLADTD